jgi:predicted lipoprotein with Yx(FWY)xxD motif
MSAAGLATVGAHSTTLGPVLVGPDGRTLYHLTSERHGVINCTGKCLHFWPPLLAAPGRAPTLAPGVHGRVGLVTRPGGGRQVTVNGMPLYYFAGDQRPGSANGQGLKDGTFGTWFVVRGSAITSQTAPATGGSGSHGYGY